MDLGKQLERLAEMLLRRLTRRRRGQGRPIESRIVAPREQQRTQAPQTDADVTPQVVATAVPPDAKAPVTGPRAASRRIRARLHSRTALRDAVVMAELLERPLALRPPRY